MIDALTQGFILVTGVGGQILVAHKNALGFWVWIASNFVLVSVSLKQELPGMAALYVFYTAMCFYSIWRWRKIEASGTQAEAKTK